MKRCSGRLRKGPMLGQPLKGHLILKELRYR
jgi:hypothetical protein